MSAEETLGRVSAAMSCFAESLSYFELVDLLLRDAPAPFVVGTHDRWLLVSESFARALGYTPSELERMDWRRLVMPEDLERTEDVLAEMAANNHHEMTYRSRVGEPVRVAWRWSKPDHQGISVAMGEILT